MPQPGDSCPCVGSLLPRTSPLSSLALKLYMFAAFVVVWGILLFANPFFGAWAWCQFARSRKRFPVSLSTSGSPWTGTRPISCGRRNPQTCPVLGGSPPTQEFLQNSGGKRDRARKGKKHEQNEPGSPKGFRMWGKSKYKNYCGIQIAHIAYIFTHDAT